MRKIIIQTIPHKDQRYNTCGDYWIDEEGTIQVRISKMKDKYEQAVIIHELAELFSVLNKKIAISDIDEFDIAFEKLREEHPEIIGDSEPGNMTSAPYYEDHQMATKVEKIFTEHNNINWKKYEKIVTNL